MMQFISGYWAYYGLAALARLGIADLLKDGTRSSADLSAEIGARPDYLYRLLRAAAALGVFAEDGDGRFSNNEMSDILRTDHVPSLRHMFISMGDEWASRAWPTLSHSVLTGRTAMDRLFGMPVWEFFSQNPEQSEAFNKAMTNLSSMESPVVVRAYDFSGLGTICDVGGGHGLLLSSVLNANPRLRGTLYDLPQVAEGARSGPLAALEGRASILSGDMFESVPAGFDAYMMKYIIHDWNDEYSWKLLANCRKGVNPGGKLLVVDQVVPPGNQFAPSKIMDLAMLLFIDGLERTETQFRNLFASAGWRVTRIIPTESPLCIVEGEPA
jgi:hypothetical protein